MYKIGFLGMGKMGSSILNGILSNNLYNKDDIAFYAPSLETKEKYKSIGIKLAKDEKDLFASSNIIIMAVKPQKYDEILEKIKGLPFNNKTIISLAPGKSIHYLKTIFKDADVVRAMPNTPALVGKAVTTIAFSTDVNKQVIDIFSSIGTYLIVDEKQIDETIPLNGSMPAYILEFIRCFIKAASNYNIKEEDAKDLALNSIIGSCMLALNSPDNLDTLINNVCSKGGSTIKGLEKLRNNDFENIIKNCYDACVKRSKELENV